MRHSDQSPPSQSKAPLHLESDGLVFNKNTGDASATGKIVFTTPQASGSAVGIQYVARTGTMNLLSAVAITVNRPQPVHLNADHGVITKQPRQVFLTAVHMTRAEQKMRSDQATFFLREDNTVDHIVAEGDVETELPGRASSSGSSNSKAPGPKTHERSDRAELFMTGTRNLLPTAILSGNVQMATGDAASRVSTETQASGSQQPAEAFAGRVTLHFAGQQVLKTVHAEDGVRLTQKSSQRGILIGSSIASSATKEGGQSQDRTQDMEMTAPVMDFIVRDGHLLERAETSGPPRIVITQPGANQKTVATAAQFTAKFTEKNRPAPLHGEPDAKIVSSMIVSGTIASKVGAPVPPDRASTSQMLDVVFLPEGGVRSITQTGALAYVRSEEHTSELQSL